MTDAERERLGALRQMPAFGHLAPQWEWLLSLAARCDAAEKELARLAPGLAARGVAGYSFGESLTPPEVQAAVLAGYDADPCPHCGERKAVRDAARGLFACEGCGVREGFP